MNANKLFFLIIIFGVATLIAAGALILLNTTASQPLAAALPDNPTKTTGVSPSSPTSDYETQKDDQANVTVEVTPTKLGVLQTENIFAVSFNTHSVSLDYDFAKISILKDNLGNVYPATTWKGEAGGHHLSGKLVFPKINSGAKSVRLEIDDIGGVKRVFIWQLK